MKLLDIMTSPWAITDGVFSQIIDIYNAHIRGPKIDIGALEARLGRPLSRTRREMPGQVTGGVAVLDLEGPLAKRMSSVNAACEGTSTNLIHDYFNQAVEDPEVKGIILNIDSPGGTVDGTMDLARAIFAARGRKPIIALADGQACSAAYWIGAAADAFFLANETSLVGSIGVVCTHADYSGALEKAGIVVTEITAGKYKRAVSSYKPLSDDGKARIQEMADDIYTLFVDDVARFKGVSQDQVLSDMAEGRVFMGEKAIAAGLVDGVSTLDALITGIANGRIRATPSRAGAARSTSTPTAKEVSMTYTREALDENAPELVTAIKEEGRAEAKAETQAEIQALKDQAEATANANGDTVANAVAAETERIKSVLEAAAGLDLSAELVNGLAFDGKTTAAEANGHFLSAVKEKRPLARIQSEASQPMGFPGATSGASEDADANTRERWESNASLRSLYGTFENYTKALEGANTAAKSGRIHAK